MADAAPPPTDAELAAWIANALARFARDARLPAAVSPGELCTRYGGPPPVSFGWHWHHRRAALHAALEARDLAITGYERTGPGRRLIHLDALAPAEDAA